MKPKNKPVQLSLFDCGETGTTSESSQNKLEANDYWSHYQLGTFPLHSGAIKDINALEKKRL